MNKNRINNLRLRERLPEAGRGIRMFFKREVLLTWDLNEYQRTKSLLADHQIEYTTRSNPVTNPGRYHGVPSINASAAYEYHVYVAGKDHDRAMSILKR